MMTSSQSRLKPLALLALAGIFLVGLHGEISPPHAYASGAGTGDLTIVASGGAATGSSTWEVTGGVLRTATATATSVNASVVVAELVSGALTIEAGTITIDTNVVVQSTTSNRFTLKSGSDVLLKAGARILTAGGDVILWAHAGELGSSTTTSGAIVSLPGSEIDTGDGAGDIVLAGGADDDGRPGGFAYGAHVVTTAPRTSGTLNGSAAIFLDDATLTAGRGGVTMRGHGTGALNDWQIGVWLQKSAVSGGTIVIDGRGSLRGVDNSNSHFGTLVAGTVIESSGSIAIEGHAGESAGASGDNNQVGVVVVKYPPTGTATQSLVKATGTGTITIVGVGGSNGSMTNSHGIYMEAASEVLSEAGDISIDGKSGHNGGAVAVVMGITPTSETGDIVFTGRLSTSGAGGGGGVTLTGAEATAGRVTVISPGAVIQTQPIIATELLLRGPGTFTLTNHGNTVGTIAGGPTGEHLGTVSYVDSSGGVTIGDVEGVSGMTATGAISILTLSGDINLTRPVQSGLTSGDAVRLSANSLAPVDDAGDGDITVSGTGAISIESGARALLFSGAATTSTGLSTLAGSVSAIRTRVADTGDLSSIQPALASTGLFVLYRVEGTGLEASAAGQGSSQKSSSAEKQLDAANANQLAATGVSPATGMLLSSLALLLIGLGSLAVRKRARAIS